MRAEGLAASGMTIATVGSWVADVQGVMGLAVTVLTLAWWIRLWIRKPDIQPPKDFLDDERNNSRDGGKSGAP